MHSLVQKLVQKYPFDTASRPVLIALLDLGAAAEPREKDRPLRRKLQMRMLRQWERLEVAVADFLDAEGNDDDLCAAGERELEPFYLQNSGWLAPGTDPERLRSAITMVILSATAHKLKQRTTMKAPLQLEDQFNTVVTSSEIAGSMLDKFLRGSLRSSNALARLLGEVKEHLDTEGEPPSEDTINEAEAALLAQGFTH